MLVGLKYKWTIRLLLLTPVLVLIAIFLMGGGHGWYEPAILLFPFGTINTVWQNHFSLPLGAIAVFQFPIYGFMIDKVKQHKRRLLTLAILIVHLLLAAIILVFMQADW